MAVPQLTDAESQTLASGALVLKAVANAKANEGIAAQRIDAPADLVWATLLDFGEWPRSASAALEPIPGLHALCPQTAWAVCYPSVSGHCAFPSASPIGLSLGLSLGISLGLSLAHLFHRPLPRHLACSLELTK